MSGSPSSHAHHYQRRNVDPKTAAALLSIRRLIDSAERDLRGAEEEREAVRSAWLSHNEATQAMSSFESGGVEALRRLQQGDLGADDAADAADADRPRTPVPPATKVLGGVRAAHIRTGAPHGVHDVASASDSQTAEDNRVGPDGPLDFFDAATTQEPRHTTRRASLTGGGATNLGTLGAAALRMRNALAECRTSGEVGMHLLQNTTDNVRALPVTVEDSLVMLELSRNVHQLQLAMNIVLEELHSCDAELRVLQNEAEERDDVIAAVRARMDTAKEAATSAACERDNLRKELWTMKAAAKLRAVLNRQLRRKLDAALRDGGGGASSPHGSARHHQHRRSTHHGSSSLRAHQHDDAGASSAQYEIANRDHRTIVQVAVADFPLLWESAPVSMSKAVDLLRTAIDDTLKSVHTLGGAPTFVSSDAWSLHFGDDPNGHVLAATEGGMPGCGDGAHYLIGFAHAADAVHWATSLQYVLHHLPWPAELASKQNTLLPVVTMLGADPRKLDEHDELRQVVVYSEAYGDVGGNDKTPQQLVPDYDELLSTARRVSVAAHRRFDGPHHDSVFRGLRVRIGVHTGAIVSELSEASGGLHVYGETPLKAAMLCRQAGGGEVLISETTLEAARAYTKQSTVFARPVPIAPAPPACGDAAEPMLFSADETAHQVLPAPLRRRAVVLEPPSRDTVLNHARSYNVHWWQRFTTAPPRYVAPQRADDVRGVVGHSIADTAAVTQRALHHEQTRAERVMRVHTKLRQKVDGAMRVAEAREGDLMALEDRGAVDDAFGTLTTARVHTPASLKSHFTTVTLSHRNQHNPLLVAIHRLGDADVARAADEFARRAPRVSSVPGAFHLVAATSLADQEAAAFAAYVTQWTLEQLYADALRDFDAGAVTMQQQTDDFTPASMQQRTRLRRSESVVSKAPSLAGARFGAVASAASRQRSGTMFGSAKMRPPVSNDGDPLVSSATVAIASSQRAARRLAAPSVADVDKHSCRALSTLYTRYGVNPLWWGQLVASFVAAATSAVPGQSRRALSLSTVADWNEWICGYAATLLPHHRHTPTPMLFDWSTAVSADFLSALTFTPAEYLKAYGGSLALPGSALELFSRVRSLRAARAKAMHDGVQRAGPHDALGRTHLGSLDTIEQLHSRDADVVLTARDVTFARADIVDSRFHSSIVARTRMQCFAREVAISDIPRSSRAALSDAAKDARALQRILKHRPLLAAFMQACFTVEEDDRMLLLSQRSPSAGTVREWIERAGKSGVSAPSSAARSRAGSATEEAIIVATLPGKGDALNASTIATDASHHGPVCTREAALALTLRVLLALQVCHAHEQPHGMLDLDAIVFDAATGLARLEWCGAGRVRAATGRTLRVDDVRAVQCDAFWAPERLALAETGEQRDFTVPDLQKEDVWAAGELLWTLLSRLRRPLQDRPEPTGALGTRSVEPTPRGGDARAHNSQSASTSFAGTLPGEDGTAARSSASPSASRSDMAEALTHARWRDGLLAIRQHCRPSTLWQQYRRVCMADPDAAATPDDVLLFDLLVSMLAIDPQQRCSITEAVEHPLFDGMRGTVRGGGEPATATVTVEGEWGVGATTTVAISNTAPEMELVTASVVCAPRVDHGAAPLQVPAARRYTVQAVSDDATRGRVQQVRRKFPFVA